MPIYKKKPLKKRAGTGKKIGFYLKFRKKITKFNATASNM